jgi:hypothetical protein
MRLTFGCGNQYRCKARGAGHSRDPADMLSGRSFHSAAEEAWRGRQRTGRDHQGCSQCRLQRHLPTPVDRVPDRQATETSKRLLFSGAKSELPPPRSHDSDHGARAALVEPVTIRRDAEVRFENADVSSAAKAVLGDVPHLKFARSESPGHGDARLGRTSTVERSV